LEGYDKARDFPIIRDGTSGLSVHLRFGTISIRSLVRLAQEVPSASSRKWLGELIWRDFYQMILDCYPHVSEGAFKPEYDAIQWPGKDEHFKAWKGGRTGYPFIDAAMRDFNATGWMHNRLRMVVASFLVKDLLVDWRKGESWFARHLLDFDLAANNGGWQWCASTGCDSQPYFRIFNPISQSKKFDPEGKFIRQALPELAKLPRPLIHTPWLAKEKINYPRPIVDHAVQRNIALALYRKARTSISGE
jgi:deoxyribodipyrimidine photo-lyase